MNASKIAILLIHAFIGWALCDATMGSSCIADQPQPGNVRQPPGNMDTVCIDFCFHLLYWTAHPRTRSPAMKILALEGELPDATTEQFQRAV